LANAIWNGQDPSFQEKHSKDSVVPVSCNPVPVPEFGSWASFILVIAIISIIVIIAKSGLSSRYAP
jgi:predicted secreted protein with PEFG-CTERM motif